MDFRLLIHHRLRELGADQKALAAAGPRPAPRPAGRVCGHAQRVDDAGRPLGEAAEGPGVLGRPILLPETLDQNTSMAVRPASESEDRELWCRRHGLRLRGRPWRTHAS